MGLSLAGITLMQIHWMLKTITLNEENFDRAVNETLTLVVDKLEKEKDIKFSMPFQGSFWYPFNADSSEAKNKNNHRYQSYTYSIPRNSAIRKLENINRAKHHRVQESDFKENFSSQNNASFDEYNLNNNKKPDTYFEFDSVLSFEYNNALEESALSQLADYTDTLSRSVKVIRNDSIPRVIIITNGHLDTINIEDLPNNLIPPPPPPPSKIYFTQKNSATHRKSNSPRNNRDNYSRKLTETINRYRVEKEVIALNTKEIENQIKKQQQALKQLVYEMDARKIDLKNRVNFNELHNLLSNELKNRGISSEFEFALVTNDPKRKEVFSTPLFNHNSAKSIYRTRLFPNNFVPLNDFLEITFPNKDTAIYKSVIIPMSASLFFTLIVLLTFTITLVTIIKQKKLAEMKADFINNMTHELKTPIATISLASDSIDNPKVVEKPESVKYFTAIIREENSRMNKLVESVLQTARLERKTLKLNLKEINLSKLIDKVADQMGIQAKAKGGSITLYKPEEAVFFIADENLMENVIFNLIDNAIKYSSSAPKVIITLKKLPGGLSLSVQDNGIGMSRGEQQRVFEKFYRVSQGDVHNIKGFGLGLSNVKEITELHGGMVQLRSELGIGSTFSLFFPIKINGNE